MLKNLYRFIFNFRNQYERFQSRDWLPTQKIKAELVEKELLDNIYKSAEQDSWYQIVKWILFYFITIFHSFKEGRNLKNYPWRYYVFQNYKFYIYIYSKKKYKFLILFTKYKHSSLMPSIPTQPIPSIHPSYFSNRKTEHKSPNHPMII